MRLAKLSFDLWGALSPTVCRNPPGMEEPLSNPSTSQSGSTESEVPPAKGQANVKRSISQAELESSLYKVKTCLYLKILFFLYIKISVVYHFIINKALRTA